MKTCSVLAAIFCVMTIGVGLERAQTLGDKSVVVRLDPALDELVSANAKLEVAKSGFAFTEGTTWIQEGNTRFLIFTDIPANVIDKMTPDGRVSVYADHVGYDGPIDAYNMLTLGVVRDNGKDPQDPLFRRFVMLGADGLTLDRQGRIVVAGWAARNVYRIEKDGKRTILADRYQGKRLGGPNDVIVKKDGAIYFTDAVGGLRLEDKDPAKELNQGVYMIKAGKLTLVINDIPTVNGLAFSPDEKHLYANGSGANYIRRYDVQPDDTLTNSTLLIDLSADKTPGITDGMKVDTKGNVYQSAAGGVWIISPDGRHLGTILTPELVANVEFGDPDHKTLYIAARTSIYRIRANTAGIP